MRLSICFNCGSEKVGPFVTCESCGFVPQGQAELTMSLALSDKYSSTLMLEHYSRLLRKKLKLSIPESVIEQASTALEAQTELFMTENTETLSIATNDERISSRSNPHKSEIARGRSLPNSQLKLNPFALLGATTRDNRQRIVELTEERSLTHDYDACHKARSDLTNPRTRLSVEMSWLPGISPSKAAQLLSILHSSPMSIRKEQGLPTLARLNLLAAAFETIDDNDSEDFIAGFISELAFEVDELSANQVLRDINEDRCISGMPEVKSVEQIEAELAERKRHYRNIIKNTLNRLSPTLLIDAMTTAVYEVTSNGENHAPELIDLLVDSYAVETQGFLEKEAENAKKLIQMARDCAKSGEGAVKPIVDNLEAVARNWDKVAQPIQLSSKARGIVHEPSHEIAYSMRGLAVDLFNEHNMLVQAQKLTELVQELFAELPEVVEQVAQDADALENIFQNRRVDEAQQKAWRSDITYQAEVGLIFKDVLSISPDGLVWKNQHFPLDSITRVRWGAVRNSVNGISSGTKYTIAFGDHRSEAVVEIKRQLTYSTFIEKLWKAVAVRLLTELLESLQAGKEVRFGEATIRDDGVTLVKHKFLGGKELIFCTWREVNIYSANGSFTIISMENKKTWVELSYIYGANTHVLEQAIRMAFKKTGMRRLSDILR